MEWLCRITPAACQIPSTLYHECTRSHKLRIMNARSHINYVQWMDAVTPTLYHECTQFVDSVKSLSFSLTRRSFGPIAYIHGTELCDCVHSWYRVNAIWWSDHREYTKISIQWLWPVKVTLKVIKLRLMVLCWSCDEGALKKILKKHPSLQFTSGDQMRILSIPLPNGRSMPWITHFKCVTERVGGRAGEIVGPETGKTVYLNTGFPFCQVKYSLKLNYPKTSHDRDYGGLNNTRVRPQGPNS